MKDGAADEVKAACAWRCGVRDAGVLRAQVLITNLGEEQVSNLPTVRDTYMRLREAGVLSCPVRPLVARAFARLKKAKNCGEYALLVGRERRE